LVAGEPTVLSHRGTPPLFLVDELADELAAGSFIELRGAEGRHAARVRRLTIGEEVLLGAGFGTLLGCRVVGVLPDGLRLEVVDRRAEPRPDPAVTVVQAVAKGPRAELAVELLTEVGADMIVPWAAARSIARWDESRAHHARQRWISTAREAAKQSRRAWLPHLTPLATTSDIADRVAAATTALVLHESADARLAIVALPEAGELLLVVGPEGGIDPSELEAFTAAGAIPVHLGATVLRTSTAGAAAVAAVSVRLDRWL
jgi:16S rRNA (uracil1498-N3)-methyltransferase